MAGWRHLVVSRKFMSVGPEQYPECQHRSVRTSGLNYRPELAVPVISAQAGFSAEPFTPTGHCGEVWQLAACRARPCAERLEQQSCCVLEGHHTVASGAKRVPNDTF
jgi:hypothetical protein